MPDFLGVARLPPIVYACGSTSTPNSTTDQALVAVGGSLVYWFSVPKPGMILISVELRDLSTATARSWEWRCYEDLDNADATASEVAGANCSSSYTPGAASDRAANLASPIWLPEGVYYGVVRNTHATSTLQLGMATSNMGTISSNSKTKTLASALGSSLDLVTGWTTTSGRIPSMRHYGKVLGQSAAW